MNKTELLADITAKALKVIDTIEEVDSVKNSAGVKSYLTNVMEQNGETITGRNIGWYTIDEGQPSEQAFYRDEPKAKKDFTDKFNNYLKGLLPETYIRYTLQSTNENDKSAKALVIKDNKDGTATEKTIFIYKNGANPIQHIELT